MGGYDLSFILKNFKPWADDNVKPMVSPILNDVEVALFKLYQQDIEFRWAFPAPDLALHHQARSIFWARQGEKLSLVGNTPMEDCVAFVNPTAARKFTTAVASGYNPQPSISESVRRATVFENANFRVMRPTTRPYLPLAPSTPQARSRSTALLRRSVPRWSVRSQAAGFASRATLSTSRAFTASIRQASRALHCFRTSLLLHAAPLPQR